MKQKYEISRDEQTGQLILKELAELDKDIMSLLCEERYDFDAVSAALEQGGDALIRTLRTKNMFPPGLYMAKIAEMAAEFIQSGANEPMEVFFQDTDFLVRYKAEEQEAKEEDSEDDEEEDSGDDEDIDELLDDDIEEVDDFKSSLGVNKKKEDDTEG